MLDEKFSKELERAIKITEAIEKAKERDQLIKKVALDLFEQIKSHRITHYEYNELIREITKMVKKTVIS